MTKGGRRCEKNSCHAVDEGFTGYEDLKSPLALAVSLFWAALVMDEMSENRLFGRDEIKGGRSQTRMLTGFPTITPKSGSSATPFLAPMSRNQSRHSDSSTHHTFQHTMTSSALSPAAKIQIAHDLRRTIRELKDRGLMVAAKW